MARKKKQHDTLTGDPELDGIAGALVLLLSELPPHKQMVVLKAAASPELIIAMSSLNLNHTVVAMETWITAIEGVFDGSSGLGRMAALNAQHLVKNLRSLHTALGQHLNVL